MNKQPSEFEQLDKLNWDIQPERDLWPAISAEIDTPSEKIVYLERPAKPWANYAIAASLLIAIFSVTFSFMSFQHLKGGQQQQLAISQFQQAQLQLIEEQHKLVRHQFIALLDSKPAYLEEDYLIEAKLLMQNIDKASDELKQAIKADPENPNYASMLVDTYHQEAKLLKTLSHGEIKTI